MQIIIVVLSMAVIYGGLIILFPLTVPVLYNLIGYLIDGVMYAVNKVRNLIRLFRGKAPLKQKTKTVKVSSLGEAIANLYMQGDIRNLIEHSPVYIQG